MPGTAFGLGARTRWVVARTWTGIACIIYLPLPSAGATMGQLLGSLVTVTTARMASSRGQDGSLHGLILVSSLLMFAAAFLSAKAKRPSGAGPLKALAVPPREVEPSLSTREGGALRAKFMQV